MKIYFGADKTDRRLIGEATTAKECSILMNKYIEENKLRSEPYRRYWEYEGEIIVDYGSHSFFFYINDAQTYYISSNVQGGE